MKVVLALIFIPLIAWTVYYVLTTHFYLIGRSKSVEMTDQELQDKINWVKSKRHFKCSIEPYLVEVKQRELLRRWLK